MGKNSADQGYYYILDEYDAFERKLTSLLEDEESVASTNAASADFRGTDPYAELENLKLYLYKYRYMAVQGLKDLSLEGSISVLEDYFSDLIGERVEFNLPKIK